ncbi:hypothetical protein TNCV_3955211 [Trichonephila clavipes]|nr:hypothetical protein TNCV_3955211 [Trichonephila clavipes]
MSPKRFFQSVESWGFSPLSAPGKRERKSGERKILAIIGTQGEAITTLRRGGIVINWTFWANKKRSPSSSFPIDALFTRAAGTDHKLSVGCSKDRHRGHQPVLRQYVDLNPRSNRQELFGNVLGCSFSIRT